MEGQIIYWWMTTFWTLFSTKAFQYIGRLTIMDSSASGGSMHLLLPWQFFNNWSSPLSNMWTNLKKIYANILASHLPQNKIEGPATLLSFLGIILDTVWMEIRLSHGKLVRILDNTWTLAKEEEGYKEGHLITSRPDSKLLNVEGSSQHTCMPLLPKLRNFISLQDWIGSLGLI